MKTQSVTFTLLYVCVFFVKWAHSFGWGGRGGDRHESSPTQKPTIIKHLMKITLRTITGYDVRKGGVSFIYNHSNAEHTQTIRSECWQSKWRSPSDFTVRARLTTRRVIFRAPGVRDLVTNQWEAMLISIFWCIAWSHAPPIAAAAASRQPGLIFLFSKRKKYMC